MIRCVWLAVWSVALFLGAVVSGAAATGHPSPMFDFHSGFWMNLHEFIYANASSSLPPGRSTVKLNQVDSEVIKRLSSSEQAAWHRFVEYYAVHYAERDLLFDERMYDIKRKLESAEASQDLKGVDIPRGLKSVLLQAAPIYRKYWWAQHDTQNRRWVAELRPLLDEQGLQLRQSLEAIYDTAWPAQPVRVETVAYASWTGAYTTVRPTQPTISTTDTRNQRTAALEVIFHESSHGMVGKLQDAIDEATSKLPVEKQKAISKSLWHAVLFYTAGDLVAGHNPGYAMYADQAGLWVRAWPEPTRALIVRDWEPHMTGAVTLNDAVTKLVNDLVSSQ